MFSFLLGYEVWVSVGLCLGLCAWLLGLVVWFGFSAVVSCGFVVFSFLCGIVVSFCGFLMVVVLHL